MNWLEKRIEDPARFERIKRGFYLFLVLVFALEVGQQLAFPSDHPHFPFETWPGWGSVYGFISCAVIIIVSKFIGVVWLMKREDFYGD